MVLKLYNIAMQLVSLRMPAHLRKRAEKGKEEIARLTERYGVPSIERPDGHIIWIHAASVGEARSILALVDLLLKRNPTWSVLVTTGTVSSARILSQELPPRAFHQYIPIDVKRWNQAFLDYWRPSLVVWVEQEIWPNMIQQVNALNIPAILANGRLTEKSFKHWNYIKFVIKNLLAPFKTVYAQSIYDGERYEKLLDREVVSSGNLKYAAMPLSYSKTKLDELKAQIGDRPVWLAASTHFGEESLLAKAHKIILKTYPMALLVLIPRHAERGSQIATGLDEHGLTYVKRSDVIDPIVEATQVYLADTLGEMGTFYRLASPVFVGGSLVPIGGHNLIEPAQLNSTIFYGPFMHNFQEMAHEFEAAGASIPIESHEDLAKAVIETFDDPAKAHHMAKSAQALITSKGHVIEDLIHDIEDEVK